MASPSLFQNDSVRRAEQQKQTKMQTQEITPYFLRSVV